MMPQRATCDQYVVGKIIDGELWLLFETYPPQVAPISDPNAKFQVFVLGEKSDMSSLISVWQHSSKFHASTLQIYSLQDLGIEELNLPEN